MSTREISLVICTWLVLLPSLAEKTHAQAIGVELHNTVMPASGAMGGASVARPQDIQSTLGLNPATLTQFHGTTIGIGAAWAERNVKINNQVNLPTVGIQPYEQRSNRPGSLVGNTVAARSFDDLQLPVTFAGGILTSADLGVDFRENPASNGTSTELFALAVTGGFGVKLTDRLSIGTALMVGSATMDGPFQAVTAAATDIAPRGSLGLTYDVGFGTTLGFTWLTHQKLRFTDVVRVSPAVASFENIEVELPQTFVWGIANNEMMNGQLLLAIDLVYKQWSEADFFGALWKDQVVVQVGAQYTTWQGTRLRLGYSYAENATSGTPTGIIGGISPLEGVNYIQALFPNINTHRYSFGIGIPDFLPNVDLDLLAGFMPENSEAGPSGLIRTSVAGYWLGAGLTWRFGGPSCRTCPNSNTHPISY